MQVPRKYKSETEFRAEKKYVQHWLSQIILDLVLLRSLQNMEVVSYSLIDNY